MIFKLAKKTSTRRDMNKIKNTEKASYYSSSINDSIISINSDTSKYFISSLSDREW